MVRTVYDGELSVSHSQFYVESRPDSGGRERVDPLAGQSNGLCGAAVPGYLIMTTGLHTGRVGLKVEVHEAEPPLVEEPWEEIVEASFRPVSSDTAIFPWGDGRLCSLDLPLVDHRVRYCGLGMELSWDDETAVLEGGPPVDHYLLQFWPAPPAPDRVIKQTTRSADHWHQYARSRPPGPTAEELAEAERTRRAIIREAHRQPQECGWGDREPSPTLREVGGNKWGLIPLDRDLLDAVDSAAPAVQREIADWALYRALAASGLDSFREFTRARMFLRRRVALSTPFQDPDGAWYWFFEQKNLPTTFVDSVDSADAADSVDGARHGVRQQAMAMSALFAAAEEDPLRAALDTLYATARTYGNTYPALLAEVR
ncbi:hypothetical protein, partial [Streptomyces sp. N35]|uniref:hypothetical protein n=1 Tax=Streptomyces sp. N35 TaxID=2795730 RepID=UPI0018F58F2C